MAHSLKVPVYHITPMEVGEAIGNINQLVFGVSVRSTQRKGNVLVHVGLHRGSSLRIPAGPLRISNQR